MSPFKEPQPRKNSAAEDAKKVIGGNWPPYAREGGEANWTNKGTPVALEVPNTPEAAKFQEAINAAITEAQWTMTDTEFNRELETAREEGRVKAIDGFQARKAALEAACALQGNQPPTNFWGNVEALEAYLRDGTKP